ncbi:MAG: DUF4159 domain-containing protein [Myxococcota bacterium]
MKVVIFSVSLGTVLTAFAAASPSAGAATIHGETPDFRFGLLRYAGGNWNPRAQGLPRLAWEIRKRTSIAIDLGVEGVDPAKEALFDYPFLVWQGDQGFPAMPDVAIRNLRKHLKMGGTLLVDVSDGLEDGAFHRSVQRELRRIFPDDAIRRVPSDHVLYKSYYLLDRHGGRVPSRSYLEGYFVESRLAVVVTLNDMAGAMARDEFGEWVYDVGAGGEVAREVTFRLGINLVMFALCLDYKEDQVHIPFILQRRR